MNSIRNFARPSKPERNLKPRSPRLGGRKPASANRLRKFLEDLERAVRINLQFMLEIRKLEEDDESHFEEEYNVWLSDEPLTNDEICQLMRAVERERKLEGKPPLVQFLPRSKRPKKTPKKTEGVHPSRRPNGPPPSAAGVKNRTQEDAHE